MDKKISRGRERLYLERIPDADPSRIHHVGQNMEVTAHPVTPEAQRLRAKREEWLRQFAESEKLTNKIAGAKKPGRVKSIMDQHQAYIDEMSRTYPERGDARQDIWNSWAENHPVESLRAFVSAGLRFTRFDELRARD